MRTAPFAAQLTEKPFIDWLRAMCVEAGDLKYADLHWLLAKEGYRCREETVRRWLKGQANPPAEAIPYILRALGEALPDLDVLRMYVDHLQGLPFRVAPKNGAPAADTPRLQCEHGVRGGCDDCWAEYEASWAGRDLINASAARFAIDPDRRRINPVRDGVEDKGFELAARKAADILIAA